MTDLNTQDVLHALLRQDLRFFIQKVFNILHPGVVYHHNWHIDAIAYALSRVSSGEDKRLLITQPPSSLKSIITSVAWPAWRLGHDPAHSFLCVSYSQDLATELSEKFRRVVESDIYKELFPGTKLIKSTQTDAQTDKGGRRFSTSIGGTLTGRGADTIIIDDPLKADEAASDVARKSVIDWYAGTLQSRLNDQSKGDIVVVMQRLHEDDLAGYILGKNQQEAEDSLGPHLAQSTWAHLNLPAIATETERVPIRFKNDGQTLSYHTRKPGDFLHDVREGHIELGRLKKELGSQRFSAQYQQDPLPLDGNLIRPQWLPRYTPEDMSRIKSKAGGMIVQSWDIATTTTSTSDWSVCTTWLKLRKDYYLLHVLRVKKEFPELKKLINSHCLSWQTNTLLIEKNGLGLSLFQALKDDNTTGVPHPIGIKVKGDKFMRMEAQSATIEAGHMHIPQDAPWMTEYLKELLAFPHSKHDDQVDSTSQFLNWATVSKKLPINAAPILINVDDDYGVEIDPDYPPTKFPNNGY